MNNTRRKAIRELSDKISDLIALLDTYKNDIEPHRDDEQGYLDCMPENLQSSEKHDTAEEAVSHLEDAISNLDDAYSSLENAVSELNSAVGD